MIEKVLAILKINYVSFTILSCRRNPIKSEKDLQFSPNAGHLVSSKRGVGEEAEVVINPKTVDI